MRFSLDWFESVPQAFLRVGEARLHPTHKHPQHTHRALESNRVLTEDGGFPVTILKHRGIWSHANHWQSLPLGSQRVREVKGLHCETISHPCWKAAGPQKPSPPHYHPSLREPPEGRCWGGDLPALFSHWARRNPEKKWQEGARIINLYFFFFFPSLASFLPTACISKKLLSF